MDKISISKVANYSKDFAKDVQLKKPTKNEILSYITISCTLLTNSVKSPEHFFGWGVGEGSW